MENENSIDTSKHQPMSTSSPTRREPKKGFWKSLQELIQFSALVLIIVLPIRFFIVEPFIVNGASMDPTFSTGQFLMVDRLSFRFKNPSRGEVIVFKYPNNPKVYYIKRIIGLPGETVSIKNGKVSIINSEFPDGFALSEPYVSTSHISSDTQDIKLKSDEYVVMGDNRAQSSDSRVWGPLQDKFIVGRPIIRLFPVNTLSVFPGKYQAAETN